MIHLKDRVGIFNRTETGRDRNNNPIYTWPPTPTSVEPAFVIPLSTQEYDTGGDTVVARWKLMLLPGTRATPASRVSWRGATYEVDGDVQMTPNQRGWPDHYEAFLQRVS